MTIAPARRPSVACLASVLLAASARAQTRVAAPADFTASAAHIPGLEAGATTVGAASPSALFPAIGVAPAGLAAPVARPDGPFSAVPTVEAAVAAVDAAAAPSAGGAPSVAPAEHRDRENAREAFAIATVKEVVSDWGVREAETLDGAPASKEDGTLAPASRRPSSDDSASAAPSPEGGEPAPSKLKAILAWAAPILRMTVLVIGIDAATKFFAMHHLHAVFHEVAWRKPMVLALIPVAFFSAYKRFSTMPYGQRVWRWSLDKIGGGRFGFYQDELSSLDETAKDHPSVRAALRLYGVAVALMLGGLLGNGIDTLRLGGAVDWIPLGRSLMNFADVALLAGLSFVQLANSFFTEAASAHNSGKSPRFSTVAYLGLPLAGVFVAWTFGTAAGHGALDLAFKNAAFIYLMAFSMLIGFARFLAAAVMNRFVKRFVAEEDAGRGASAPKA